MLTILGCIAPGTPSDALVSVDLVLFKIKDHSRDPIDAFSLLFHEPKSHELPQSIYGMRNERLGELDLFLVPILQPGLSPELVRYQAVFSRIV